MYALSQNQGRKLQKIPERRDMKAKNAIYIHSTVRVFLKISLSKSTYIQA
jgi:hypothetical protein